MIKSQASVKDTDDQSTWSGDLIGSNDDLLTEILLRLPATSIIRFKSVSKHWRWLLSLRSFTQRFDNLSKSRGIFFRNEYVPFDVEEYRINNPLCGLDLCNDPHGIKIVQSCNGLLLCSSDTIDKGDRRYYVYNPTTQHFAIIPTVPRGVEPAKRTIQLMALAFHPTDCVHYKVVCIQRLKPYDEELSLIQIYSSDTRKWKISIEITYRYCCYYLDKIYLNGAIHFSPTNRGHMYFDIASEQLHTVPCPKDVLYYQIETWYFGESRGHLHLIATQFYIDFNITTLNVYELLGDRSGWFVKYRVHLNELSNAFPEMIKIKDVLRYHFYNVVDLVRGAKEDDTFMVLTIPGKFIIYNIYDKSFKEIFNHDSVYKYHMFRGYSHVHRYTETLASL